MDGLTFIAKLIEIMVWPMAIIIIAIVIKYDFDNFDRKD